MGAKHFDSRVYEMPSERIVDIVKSRIYSDELNLALKSENPTDTGVWFRFHHGVTFTSWGEKITVTITALQGNTTKVDILSECGMPTQVIDFGKNQRNVNTLFECLNKHLKSNIQPLPVENRMIGKDVTEASNTTLCARCGALLAQDAAFCSKCGAKVEKKVNLNCPRCGKTVNADDVFCSGCGTKL